MCVAELEEPPGGGERRGGPAARPPADVGRSARRRVPLPAQTRRRRRERPRFAHRRAQDGRASRALELWEPQLALAALAGLPNDSDGAVSALVCELGNVAACACALSVSGISTAHGPSSSVTRGKVRPAPARRGQRRRAQRSTARRVGRFRGISRKRREMPDRFERFRHPRVQRGYRNRL